MRIELEYISYIEPLIQPCIYTNVTYVLIVNARND